MANAARRDGAEYLTAASLGPIEAIDGAIGDNKALSLSSPTARWSLSRDCTAATVSRNSIAASAKGSTGSAESVPKPSDEGSGSAYRRFFGRVGKNCAQVFSSGSRLTSVPSRWLTTAHEAGNPVIGVPDGDGSSGSNSSPSRNPRLPLGQIVQRAPLRT